jgi:hypothetical protein
VLLDYDDPDDGTAQVAMLRVSARGESIGPLLLNSGGPGGTGMNFAALLAGTLAQNPVTDRLRPPRGGRDHPGGRLLTDDELRTGQGQSEFLVSAGTLTEDGARQLVERCAQRSGGAQALAAIATRDTGRDMDVLRAALGEEQLTGTVRSGAVDDWAPALVRALLPKVGRLLGDGVPTGVAVTAAQHHGGPYGAVHVGGHRRHRPLHPADRLPGRAPAPAATRAPRRQRRGLHR